MAILVAKSVIIFLVCLYFLFSLLNNPIPVWPAKEGRIHITPSQAKVGEGKILSYNFKFFLLANRHIVQTKKKRKTDLQQDCSQSDWEKVKVQILG